MIRPIRNVIQIFLDILPPDTTHHSQLHYTANTCAAAVEAIPPRHWINPIWHPAPGYCQLPAQLQRGFHCLVNAGCPKRVPARFQSPKGRHRDLPGQTNHLRFTQHPALPLGSKPRRLK
jgi:hypothetical protein